MSSLFLVAGFVSNAYPLPSYGFNIYKSAPKPAADQQPLPGMQLPPKPKRGRPSKAMLAAKEAEKQAAEAAKGV